MMELLNFYRHKLGKLLLNFELIIRICADNYEKERIEWLCEVE